MVYTSHILFFLHVGTFIVLNNGLVEASRKAGFIFGKKQFFSPSRIQNLRSALCSDLSPLVSSPSSFSSMNPLVESTSSPSSTLIDSEFLSSDQDKFDQLCHHLGATPKGLLRLETTDDGVRGVNVNRDVQRGGSLLTLPLSSCLCDHLPPSWFKTEDDSDDLIETQGGGYLNPSSSWATRLAASLLDVQLQSDLASTGQKLWLSLLPNKELLRASLPVHWNSDTVQATHCTALEVAVDTAYFARAQAISDLSSALRNSNLVVSSPETASQDVLDQLCHDALDVVQTRSCRLENALNMDLYSQPIRILAPIFDFINHGSSFRGGGTNSANACFGLEMDENSFDVIRSGRLVVTATRDLKKNEEVLIDYGSSARPAWTCLASYGFVPFYQRVQHDKSPQESFDDDDDDEETEDVENVAEVYMNGVRYEVGPSTIPYEMVEAMEAIIRAESFVPTVVAAAPLNVPSENPLDESRLTPEIAIRIAKRISDVAYQLLLQPVVVSGIETEDGDNNDGSTTNPEHLVSAKLANSLRWSQHNILLACALGLRDWAVTTPE